MLTRQIVILCLVLIESRVDGYKIKSYNVNKYAKDSFDYDCLQTTRTNISIPPTITICYRFKPVITHYGTYGTIFMGNLNENRTEVEVGLDFSIWSSSGPWVGLREKGQSVVWVGMGDGAFDLLTWRHTCLSINFKDGHSILYENGNKYVEGTFQEYVNFNPKMPETVNFISFGCGPTIYTESFVGVLTDLQIFGRVLSTQEMEEWTGCRKRMYGEVLNWDTENWFFNVTGNKSEIEHLDFKSDICNRRKTSNHVFPLMVPFPKALEICEKATGQLFQ